MGYLLLVFTIFIAVTLPITVHACGGVLTEEGSFSSPNYPSNYGNNAACTWTINVDEGYDIKITFSTPFQLEGVANCPYDYVKIFDVQPNGIRTEMRKYCGSNTPPVYTSRTRKVRVEFKTDGGGVYKGFSAKWEKVALVPCGGIFTSDVSEGFISSLNYTYSYDNRQFCKWDINMDEGYVIMIAFSTLFQLESPCTYNYFKIFDVQPDGRRTEMKKYCGSRTPPVYTSRTRRVQVEFRSDSSNVYRGFSANWEKVAHVPCGVNFTSDVSEGFISSLNYIYSYDNRQFCKWAINMDEGYVIMIAFSTRFQLESPCTNNSVKIFEVSASGNRTLRRTYCGSSAPSDFTSTTPRVEVEFDANVANDYTGFFASWTKIAKTYYTIVQGNQGNISSGNHPQPFNDNTNRRWMIIVPPGQFIKLEFNSTFNLGTTSDNSCNENRLEIFDVFGNNSFIRRGRWFGTDRPPVTQSFGNSLMVELHSVDNNDKNDTDFFADWSATASCDRVINITTSQGYIMSYNFYRGEGNGSNIAGTTLSNSSCGWTFDVPNGFDWITFDMDPSSGVKFCEDDPIYGNVYLHSPDASCVHTKIWVMSSLPSREVTLHFDPESKFFASWTAVCGRRFTSTSGKFTSPKYRASYPENVDCEWKIVGEPNHDVHLKFDEPFELESTSNGVCDYDYVEVFDSMTDGDLVSRGKFCGNTAPPALTLSTSSAVVRFHSDRDKTGRGFSLTWDTACNEVYESDEGNISTPNYPAAYPYNFHCRWEIRVTPGNSIQLSFKSPFGLEDHLRCASDYVELFDVASGGALRSKGRWCGKTVPPLQTSTSSKMVVVFHSDYRKPDTGFFAEWHSVCGQVFEGPQGYFTSPGYPLDYPADLTCRWEVKVHPGQRVRLQFDSTFLLDTSHEKCGYNDVEVIDYFSNGTQVSNGRVCSARKTSVITSVNSHILILLHSDSDLNGKGFEASWQTVPGCGDTFTTSQGYLMSPNYPSQYPPDLTCRWEITPPSGANITLQFDSLFEMEPGNDCAWDHLEIHRGNTKLGRWCGTDEPPVFNFNATSGETLVVTFVTDNTNGGQGFFASWTTP